MNKEKLDGLLETYNAQPVGLGYIDIIVNRENYKSFVNDLISNGYKIESVSCWEWCPGDNENEYGLEVDTITDGFQNFRCQLTTLSYLKMTKDKLKKQ